MKDLQPNEDVLRRYQHLHSNPNKVRVGAKLLIPLSHLSDYVECEWWIYKSKLITLDTAEESVLLVVKVIVRV